MSRNYYSEINLHLVWRVKNSQPLLTARLESVVHQLIRQKIANTPGAFYHEINGTEDHVHAVVSVVPTILISEFIGQLKGFSSYEANQKLGDGSKVIEWQSGYGVVSFGTKDLEWVKGYVRNQKEHHRNGTTQERLERIDQADTT
jgi:putative transposase